MTENPIPVHYEYSPGFVDVLQHLKSSIVLSTYQAGKVLVLGLQQGQVAVSVLDYDRPMGVAIGSDRIAVGAGSAIHFMVANHAAAATVPPAGTFDGCFVPHTSRHTGKILVHDLGWGHEGLWIVNTLFSCLCTLDDAHSFVPRWMPSFISRLGDEDRCHLNGMAMNAGQPKFVTALATTDHAAGWRENKAQTGCVIDVASGEIVTRGLCMPHSPRLFNNDLFVLNSGMGHLSRVDHHTGKLDAIEAMPGYTRGLAFAGQFAFVGLSRIRETNVFGGLPIGEYRDQLCCGIGVVDMTSGKTVATLRFLSGVEEIFAVDVIPGFENLAIGGSMYGEKQQEVWIVPATLPNHSMTQSSATAMPSVEQLKLDAVTAHQTGQLEVALGLYKLALQQAPSSSELYSLLGNLQQDLAQPVAALASYEQSLELDPLQSNTQRNVAILYGARNEPLRALRHLELAQQSAPHPLNFVLGTNLLPIIYESTEQVTYWRGRLTDRIDNLVKSGVKIDTTQTMIPTTFYFAYQGENDRPLMEQLAKVYQGERSCEAAKDGSWKPRAKKLRVGFVSAYFCQHTIGQLNLGVIQRLPRDQFEVYVVALASHHDARTMEYRRAADHFVEVPRQPGAAQRAIAELQLDILLFTDVGMDSMSQLLSYSRMAPIQAVTWGHPDTTGSPEIDYFVSTELAEPDDALDHYSESLIRLATMGVYYERPKLTGPTRDKASFGLDPKSRVYLCPQTLFKLHPDYDEVLRRILYSDPQGDLVLIASSTPQWNEAVMRRWEVTMPEAVGRVRFLHSQPRDQFLHLLSMADVMLDPFPFCGGNTSYEAMAMGTPVVTLPGKYLRGRLTSGIYKRMQFETLVTSSVEDYVDQAVRVANDRSYAQQMRSAINETASRLFNQQADVDVYAQALVAMTEM